MPPQHSLQQQAQNQSKMSKIQNKRYQYNVKFNLQRKRIQTQIRREYKSSGRLWVSYQINDADCPVS